MFGNQFISNLYLTVENCFIFLLFYVFSLLIHNCCRFFQEQLLLDCVCDIVSFLCECGGLCIVVTSESGVAVKIVHKKLGRK